MCQKSLEISKVDFFFFFSDMQQEENQVFKNSHTGAKTKAQKATKQQSMQLRWD